MLHQGTSGLLVLLIEAAEREPRRAPKGDTCPPSRRQGSTLTCKMRCCHEFEEEAEDEEEKEEEEEADEEEDEDEEEAEQHDKTRLSKLGRSVLEPTFQEMLIFPLQYQQKKSEEIH